MLVAGGLQADLVFEATPPTHLITGEVITNNTLHGVLFCCEPGGDWVRMVKMPIVRGKMRCIINEPSIGGKWFFTATAEFDGQMLVPKRMHLISRMNVPMTVK